MATLTLAVCARNAQDIIGDCLASVRDQTMAPDEVIVAVDDASDPTIPVAESFGARIVISPSTGLYEARNAVLNACTTDYLAFKDADCGLVPEWVDKAKNVLDTREDIAAGTGRHPPMGTRNLASWLHHMWYVVEVTNTGATKHVIGGNSFFRTKALREVGGWLPLPRHSAAEDMYISEALRRAGHGIWFEEGVAARHHYETRLRGLWSKGIMMGRDIVVMMRASGWRGSLWWYTLSIPVMVLVLLLGVGLLFVEPAIGAALVGGTLAGSFLYLTYRFGGVRRAFPRWIARWFLIAPYSIGIVQGLAATLPAMPAPELEK